MDNTEQKPSLPLLPLRDVVVFPHMVVPLFVGRSKSVNSLSNAMNLDKKIVLVTQKNAGVDAPGEKDVFSVGTVGTVLQLLKLPDGTVKALVEGKMRAHITRFIDKESFILGEIEPIFESTIVAIQNDQ